MQPLTQMKQCVLHSEQIDLASVRAEFFDNRRHRGSLFLPFSQRTGRTLCIIGQNPSDADERCADKTIRYLENLIYDTQPQYGALLVLNLYSRVDTQKSATEDLLHARCAKILDTAIQRHEDILLVYGKLRVQGAYDFPDRARAVAAQLNFKNVFKLDIGTKYFPHPGNPKILYRNFNVPLVRVSVSLGHCEHLADQSHQQFN
ncbi:MAG: DUF1643 domain-containing protein [Hydrogenophaga sp.]|nr:DUF1643 domain-containing protein [Hydrogenophaga sp.]